MKHKMKVRKPVRYLGPSRKQITNHLIHITKEKNIELLGKIHDNYKHIKSLEKDLLKLVEE